LVRPTITPPALSLLSRCRNDIAFVRTDKELEVRVREEGAKEGLRCQVKYWGMGWEIEEYFGEGGVARQL
jgi:hypothetical protein